MSSAPPSKTERVERLRSRLKDVLWEARTRHGYKVFLDRVMPYLTFSLDLSDTQFDALFANCPKRASANFASVLLLEVQSAVESFRAFCQTGKNYHRVFLQIVHLEELLRVGAPGCQFVPDDVRGYVLRVK